MEQLIFFKIYDNVIKISYLDIELDESIVKGENAPVPGTPESFNVLVKELQSLCLDVVLERGSSNETKSSLLASIDDSSKLGVGEK